MKSRNNTGLTSLYRVNESNVTLTELLHQFILSLVCASISRDKYRMHKLFNKSDNTEMRSIERGRMLECLDGGIKEI